MSEPAAQPASCHDGRLAKLEAEVRRIADEIEPLGSERILLGYFAPTGLQVRRLAMRDAPWVNVAEQMQGKLGPAAERLLDVLWPDCDPEMRRMIVTGASMIGKLPFLKRG